MDYLRGIGDAINPYAAHTYPRPISPVYPDFSKCSSEYGRELTKSDCKEAVKTMPWARQGIEKEWAVNYLAQEYHLPMNIGWIHPPGTSLAGTRGNCVISIEAAGPQSFYDVSTTNVPFNISASPFQLRGLAAHVVSQCVSRGGFVGGFVTDKVSNLVDYLEDPNTDLSREFPLSAHFITVTVRPTVFKDPQPGNTDPSIPVFIASYLKSRMQGANNAIREKLGAVADRMVTVSQKMSPAGNTPWWQRVSDAADKMAYDCDAQLGVPAPHDCAKVEDGQLGADDDTISVGAGVVKLLSSGTCQVAVTAATVTTLNWRQIRTALDTLFNICVQPPWTKGSGGKAYFRAPNVSRRSRREKRQDDDQLTGLNALPPGAILTISRSLQRPPERELGANSTSTENSTMLVNTTYAVPAL